MFRSNIEVRVFHNCFSNLVVEGVTRIWHRWLPPVLNPMRNPRYSLSLTYDEIILLKCEIAARWCCIFWDLIQSPGCYTILESGPFIKKCRQPISPVFGVGFNSQLKLLISDILLPGLIFEFN